MLQQALQLGRSCFQRLALTSIMAWSTLGCAAELRERTVSDVRLLETTPQNGGEPEHAVLSTRFNPRASTGAPPE